MKKAKTTIGIAATCLAIIVVAAWYWKLHRPATLIRSYQQRYESLRQGATLQQVKESMGDSYSVRAGPAPFWDDKPLAEQAGDSIALTISYRVETFFLPVSFAFSFDAAERLVGKHRYD